MLITSPLRGEVAAQRRVGVTASAEDQLRPRCLPRSPCPALRADPPPRGEGEEASIDRSKADRDQRHADEMLRLQALAKNERSKQDRADGDEEGHQHQVGGACCGQNAEEQHIGDGGRQNGETGERQPGFSRRHGKRPGMIDKERNRQKHDGRARHLTGGGNDGRQPHAAEATSEYAGQRIAEGGTQHRKLRQHIGTEGCEHRRADHQSHAGEADDDADQAVSCHLLIRRQEMGNDDGKERRGGVEDRGEAACDMGLTPDDQQERNDVVQEAHPEEGKPRLTIPRHGMAGRSHDNVQSNCRQPDARGDDGEGRKFAHQNAVEQEGATPKNG
ncbi:hypothetical protein RHSP_65756 [Rhizobium freirei PRF 81]|uniref:Uncharacterized protein n=1 Tax=Rhizobium freirei PRF 81 TaxID=363754 RepID=N6UA92_9HYPH|nr:hypothetical protein RHSP_65756 [Rhizobium freirei PRF 81]